MHLLTTLIVKNSHIYARISFMFLKNVLKQAWMSFNNKFPPQSKYRKGSYKARKILALFCNLIALIQNQNCVKYLRIIKIVKEIKF